MPINYDAPIEIRDNRNGSWYWVHTHVLRDNRLSMSAKVVYSTIASYCSQQQESYPSVMRISKDSGVTERHVYRCLKSLEKAGLIAVKRRAKKGMSNIYTLLKTVPGGGDDIVSPLTNKQEGDDISTVGGDDKSAVLTRSNITISKNNKRLIKKITEWAYIRSETPPAISKELFSSKVSGAIEKFGEERVTKLFDSETNAIRFLTNLKSLC